MWAGSLRRLAQACLAPGMANRGRTGVSTRLYLVARRLALAAPLLLIVTTLAFLILNGLSGNTAQLLLGTAATPQQVAALEARLHLDRPLWERYIDWLSHAIQGDLGNSFTSSESVSALLWDRLPVTLELAAVAFLLSLLLSVPVALCAARKPGGPFDRISLFLSMAGLSVANYVLALVLTWLLAVRLRMFPVIGFHSFHSGIGPNLRSLTLPSLALAVPLASLYVRFLRGDLVEQLQGQDYVTTAVAKGVRPWRVLIDHALRNSLFGLLTLVGVNFGVLIGGAVIVEQIFALPGVGLLLLQAINSRDATVVQGVVLLLTLLTVLANLIVDLLYVTLDPRVATVQS
jgi:peptide/nickel transport system permease protein